MKPEPQFQEPRSSVVFRYTTESIRNSHHTDASFAQAVADQYMTTVAPNERVIAFHAGTCADSIEKAQKANAQLIARFRAGTVKLPVDLEEAWIQALPPPWSDDCARELAQRYGFLGARAPQMDTQAGVLGVARMSVEFGHTLQALSNVLEDGRVCPQDIPELRKARRELADLLAEVQTMACYVDGHLQQMQPMRVVSGSTR